MTTDSTKSSSENPYWVLWILVLLVAAFVRFYNLDYKVMHHDEGVNHFFINNLIRQHTYKYDPTNYHGPSLYFLSQPLARWADKTGHMAPWVLRVIPATFGVGVVALCWGLRRRLGEEAALAGAALLTVSPGMVFISRYYIHEMILVCATLGFFVCLLTAWDDPVPEEAGAPTWALVLCSILSIAAVFSAAYLTAKLRILLMVTLAGLGILAWRYDGPRAFSVVGTGVGAGLMFATKETAFISVGVLMIAATMAWLAPYFWALWFPAPKGSSEALPAGPVEEFFADLSVRGGLKRLGALFTVFVAVFFVINVVYYSSFFTNSKGVGDSLEAFKVWKKTGGKDHLHGKLQYIQWLWQEEGCVLVVGLLGAFYLLTRSRPRIPILVGLWAIGIVSGYSLIGYKTPWLLPNFILPLALTAGWALMQLPRTAGLPLLGICLGVASYQSYQINVIHYDDDKYVYVYGHSTRQVNDLVKAIFEVAATRQGMETKINCASPDFWPIPFYLRDFKNVGYFNVLSPQIDQDMVIVNHNQVGEFDYKWGKQYRRRQGPVKLRPGVDLYLYEKLPLPAGVPEIQPSPNEPSMNVIWTPPSPSPSAAATNTVVAPSALPAGINGTNTTTNSTTSAPPSSSP